MIRRLSIALPCALFACAHASSEPSGPSRLSIPSWVEQGDAHAPTSKVVPGPIASTKSLGDDAAPPRPRKGKRVTLDLVKADLPNVCRLIGELAGVNVVVADGVTGTVTMKLRDVQWEDALDAILSAKGYHAERVGSVVVIK